MKQTLTTKSLDAMKPATLKRYEVRDAKTPGLHVRVSTTGTRMFYTMSRANGKRRRVKIGPYPVLSLAPFDMSLTQRTTWLQRKIINPIVTLEAALTDENGPHFAHWERYGDVEPVAEETLLASLAELKNRATRLQAEFADEITGDKAGKIAHTRDQALHCSRLLV